MSRIIALTVSNFKRLTAAHVPLKAGVNKIAGKNGQGKSSLLDAVAAALSGREIPDKPIHDGAKNAEIVVETDQIVITRRFTASGTTLLVENKDRTSKFKNPQAMLDELTGGPNARLFDPSRFIRQSDTAEGRTAQRAQFQALVGLDFTKLEAEKKRLFEERTLVKREGAACDAAAKAMPHHADAPDKEVSPADIIAQINEANAKNADAERLANAAELAKQTVDTKGSAVVSCEKEIAELEAKLTAAKAKLRTAKMELLNADEAHSTAENAAKVDRIDTSALTQQLQNCEATNAKIRANALRAAKIKDAEAKEARSVELTVQIEALEEEKRKALASAKFPIDGLSFDESGVLYNGQPFTQASDAEKLRVAVAICAAMQPGLKTMVIRNGCFFDKSSMELLGELCEKHDVQCLVEVVTYDDEAPAGAIEIVDGTAKETK